MPSPLPPSPANESDRLAALRRYKLLDTPADEAFDDFAKIAAALAETPIALMSLVDENRQWFKSRIGLEIQETPREQAFCAHTIMGQEPFVVEDATVDPRFAENPLVTSEPNIRFYTGAPLIDREGYALGSLCVIDRKPRRLTPQQTEALQALARRIISELEFRRASSELAEALEDVRTLQGLLPICSHCHQVRDDQGYWQNVDRYLATHTNLDISHGVCPKCLPIHYPDVYARMVAKGKIQPAEDAR